MPAEWPITAAPPGARDTRTATAFAAARGDRLWAIVQDLFLSPDARLTEQERALMSAMLHGLVERIAVEIRARLSADTAASCEVATSELVADLTRAGLVQDKALVALLLRRADVQRIASSGRGGRSTLQGWTASRDADIAAAAMTLITARGRGRDRFGRVSLGLWDLPAPVAQSLVMAVAAALAHHGQTTNDTEFADAANDLLASRAELSSVEEVETALVEALGSEGRQRPGLLVALAEEGDAPILAAVLGMEASIPPGEAWDMLLGGAEEVGLLLRLSRVPRTEVAALLASASPAFGIGDPVRAIEAFDALNGNQVEEARAELLLPSAYRHARRVISRHG